MAEFAIAAIGALALFAGLVLLLRRVRTPSYRLQPEAVLELLRDTLDGEPVGHRWQLFVGLPIRHEQLLEDVRQRCLELEDDGELRLASGNRVKLTGQGRAVLTELIDELVSRYSITALQVRRSL